MKNDMPLSNHTPLQDQANSTYVNIPGFLCFEWPANLPAEDCCEMPLDWGGVPYCCVSDDTDIGAE